MAQTPNLCFKSSLLRLKCEHPIANSFIYISEHFITASNAESNHNVSSLNKNFPKFQNLKHFYLDLVWQWVNVSKLDEGKCKILNKGLGLFESLGEK